MQDSLFPTQSAKVNQNPGVDRDNNPLPSISK